RHLLPAGTLPPAGAGDAVTFRASGGPGLRLRREGDALRLGRALTRLDLAGLDPSGPSRFAKLLLKIGDDCFSSILACTPRGRALDCRPESSAIPPGPGWAGGAPPLVGPMVGGLRAAPPGDITAFAQPAARYVFPPLRPGSWRLRARLV